MFLLLLLHEGCNRIGGLVIEILSQVFALDRKQAPLTLWTR